MVGSRCIGVLHYVKRTVVLALHKGSVHTDVAAAGTQAVVDLLGHFVYQFCQFLCTGLALELLLKLGDGLAYLVHGANLVQGQAHDAALLCQCLQDSLANPPHSIADELEASGLVKLLCSLDEANISLVDEVGQAETLVLVLFCY